MSILMSDAAAGAQDDTLQKVLSNAVKQAERDHSWSVMAKLASTPLSRAILADSPVSALRFRKSDLATPDKRLSAVICKHVARIIENQSEVLSVLAAGLLDVISDLREVPGKGKDNATLVRRAAHMLGVSVGALSRLKHNGQMVMAQQVAGHWTESVEKRYHIDEGTPYTIDASNPRVKRKTRDLEREKARAEKQALSARPSPGTGYRKATPRGRSVGRYPQGFSSAGRGGMRNMGPQRS